MSSNYSMLNCCWRRRGVMNCSALCNFTSLLVEDGRHRERINSPSHRKKTETQKQTRAASMSAEITNNHEKVLTVKVSGKLTQPELASAQKQALKILQKEGTKRLLVVIEDFEGWGKGNWGDMSGQVSMEPFIDRMAIVGD